MQCLSVTSTLNNRQKRQLQSSVNQHSSVTAFTQDYFIIYVLCLLARDLFTSRPSCRLTAGHSDRIIVDPCYLPRRPRPWGGRGPSSARGKTCRSMVRGAEVGDGAEASATAIARVRFCEHLCCVFRHMTRSVCVSQSNEVSF